MEHSKDSPEIPALLVNLFALLEAHRPAFGQKRVFRRAVALLLGEVFSFGRHTVTQLLLTLGLPDSDWSAWYRLFSRRRFDEPAVTRQLLQATLVDAPLEAPYVVAVDGVQVPRSSLKMPGTGWLKAPRTPPFRIGIHRAQHFLHGAWLTGVANGYSRAIPLRWLSAWSAKAVPGSQPARREWVAGRDFLNWVRTELDAAGRAAQPLLCLGDGKFDVLGLWQTLPDRCWLAVRTARNRALFALPQRTGRRGRPPSYGPRAPTPADWLQVRRGWTRQALRIRGRDRELRYRVEGPYVRQDLPDVPLFLIVVGGMHRYVQGRLVKRKPAFYLVSAVPAGDTWQLPLPLEVLLVWLWQRWEVEVAHREMKSGFGVGQKQCWSRHGALVSVQWSVWVYAVLLLAGYRTWGLLDGPSPPGRWWTGAPRWSLATLWRGYRAAFWGQQDFRPLWQRSPYDWPEKEAWIDGLWNAVTGAAAI